MAEPAAATPNDATMREFADNLICPITQELPLDPVLAEDGRIYERAAITQWIATQWIFNVTHRSPFTNETMGARLQGVRQVRHTIEKLVDSGALEADMAARWRERLEEEKSVNEMRRKAEEEGDDDAMLHIAVWHQYGLKGLPRLPSSCFYWFKQAAEAGNPRGLACCGECYVSGEGVEKNVAYGLHMMTLAATRGSEAGAFCLGLWFCEGLNGLPVDASQAKYWLDIVTSGPCKYPGLSPDARELAEELAVELSSVSAVSPKDCAAILCGEPLFDSEAGLAHAEVEEEVGV